jgi:hypothetical protein
MNVPFYKSCLSNCKIPPMKSEQKERDWKVIQQAFFFLLFLLSPFFIIFYGVGGHHFHLYYSALWFLLKF